MDKINIKQYLDKSPEEIIRNAYAKIPKNMTSTFGSTFIFGILVHLYIFTNLLVNHDSTIFLISDMDIMISGRWFIREASSLSGIFQIPMVIGILTIVFISLSAAFTVYILKIKRRLFGCIIGMVMISVPIIAGMFAFMFTADAYAISLFLSVLSVYFAQKKGLINGVIAVVLLMFSTAIYQVYCQFALTLFVILIIIEVMKYEAKTTDVLIKGIKYCVVWAGGVATYRIALAVILAVQKTDLSFASFTMMDNFENRIRTALSLFRRNMIEFRGIYGYEIVKCIYIASILLSICFITAYIVKQPKGNRLLRLCISGILFCCIPLAQNILLIVTDSHVHNLTRYPYILSVLFILKLVDMLESSFYKNVYVWCVSISFAIVLWCNFLFTNECYLSLHLTDMNSYALANRIVERIETTDGWREDMPVLIVGNYDAAFDDSIISDTKPILHARIRDVFGIMRLDYVYHRPYVLYTYINDYIGKSLVKVTEEDMERIRETGKVDTMGNFPAEDSVMIIDDIMVVRLSDPDWSVVNILNDSSIVIR